MRLSNIVVTMAAALPAALLAISAQAYEETTVSNGGTIQGKVSYQGRVPMKKIIPTKDQDVCGGIRDQPEVVLGPDKGVRHAVVYLKKMKSGKAWPTAEPARPTTRAGRIPRKTSARAGYPRCREAAWQYGY